MIETPGQTLARLRAAEVLTQSRNEFALEQAARRVGLSLPKIVEKIDEGRARERPAASLASAVRVFLLGARA